MHPKDLNPYSPPSTESNAPSPDATTGRRAALAVAAWYINIGFMGVYGGVWGFLAIYDQTNIALDDGRPVPWFVFASVLFGIPLMAICSYIFWIGIGLCRGRNVRKHALRVSVLIAFIGFPILTLVGVWCYRALRNEEVPVAQLREE